MEMKIGTNTRATTEPAIRTSFHSVSKKYFISRAPISSEVAIGKPCAPAEMQGKAFDTQVQSGRKYQQGERLDLQCDACYIVWQAQGSTHNIVPSQFHRLVDSSHYMMAPRCGLCIS